MLIVRYKKILLLSLFLIIIILNSNSKGLKAQSNNANYSVTISIPEKKVEQKINQIKINFQIEGYGNLNDSVIIVSSDYAFLRLDTYNMTVIKMTPEGIITSKITPPVNEKTFTSWADMDISQTLATDYPQIIVGTIKIDIDEKVPLGNHKIKLVLIGKTIPNTYFFSDSTELQVIDIWEANPLLTPLFTFFLGLISGITFLLIGSYLEKRRSNQLPRRR